MVNGENNSYKINLRKRNPTRGKISKPNNQEEPNMLNKEINNKQFQNGEINGNKNIMDINEIEVSWNWIIYCLQVFSYGPSVLNDKRC